MIVLFLDLCLYYFLSFLFWLMGLLLVTSHLIGGLRKGIQFHQPCLPYFSYVLSRIICKVENSGKIHRVKVSKISPSILNLMFADDQTIFCIANVEESKELKKCLDLFFFPLSRQIIIAINLRFTMEEMLLLN